MPGCPGAERTPHDMPSCTIKDVPSSHDGVDQIEYAAVWVLESLDLASRRSVAEGSSRLD
jgi:hypothetical protein